MALGLAYRVEPEIDERSAEREAREFSSKLSEELSEIDPLEAQQMFGDDIEEYLEETDEMISEFSFEGLQDPSGFGGDVLYEQGPAEMPQPQQEQESLFETFAPEIFGEVVAENFFSQDEPLDVNRIDDEGDGGMGVFQTIAIGSLLNDLVKEPIGEQLKDVGGILAAVKTGSLKTAAATTTLGALFVGGLAGVVVGGLALSFLEGIVNSLAQQSPLLASVLDIFGLAVSLFFRPFGDLLAQALLPIGVALLELAAGFNEVASGEGIAAGIAYLFDRLIGALFSLDGLFVAALTGAATVIGGALGAVIGSFVAAKTGAVVGATIGSIIPGGGTVIGAGIGAILGLIVGLLSSLLIVFNVDLKAILNDLKEEFFLSIKPVTDFLATIQNLLIGYLIAYYEFKANVEQWLDKKLGQIVTYLKELFNTFQEGGFSAVIDKLLDDTGIGDFLAGVIPEVDWEFVYEEIIELVPEIPKVNWEFIYEEIVDLVPDIPEIDWSNVYNTIVELVPDIPEVDWDNIYNEIVDSFPSIPEINWSNIYNDIVDLVPSIPEIEWRNIYDGIIDLVPNISQINWDNVYDGIIQLVPSIPSISWSNIYNDITAKFPSVPSFEWRNYIPEIDWNLSGFDWGQFIPTFDIDLPDFPGWEEVVTGAADTVGNVIDKFEDIASGASPEVTDPQPGGGGGGGGSDDDESITGGDDEEKDQEASEKVGGSGDPDDADGGDDPYGGPSNTPNPKTPGAAATGGFIEGDGMAMLHKGERVIPASQITDRGRADLSQEMIDVIEGMVGTSSRELPMARVQQTIDNSSRIENVPEIDNDSVNERSLERAFERAIDRIEIDTDNEDVITELQKVRTEIRRMRDEMDINVEFKDSSKWEVNK